ncbi:MAG: hypothetical protein KDD83_01685 [Caldilineaceae bacterium]|nr:hypothetical protein [Caldilineaceae bacterium]
MNLIPSVDRMPDLVHTPEQAHETRAIDAEKAAEAKDDDFRALLDLLETQTAEHKNSQGKDSGQQDTE